MTDRLDFETRLEDRLRARAALASRPFDAAEIARDAVTADGRRWRLGTLVWPSGRPALRWLVVAGLLAIALLGAIAGVGALLREQHQVPSRLAVIEQAIDAVNDRDLETLRSSFTADGTLEFPAVDARSGREGNVDMTDRSLNDANFPEAWVGALDKWGLEARINSCRVASESTISCAVRTRWHVLQVEIGEDWTFDFDEARVRRLVMARFDGYPPNRVLPLGLGDLERWEAWLRQTHAEQADRLLPTGPDEFGHFYFRFGPDASPEEIGASIREYLESRDPLVGTYVCSEAGNPEVTDLWDVREDGAITRASGETGEALSAGTWSRDHGRVLTDFEGGMTWFEIQEDRLVIPGGWACTPSISR
jgi:hypothetical protein